MARRTSRSHFLDKSKPELIDPTASSAVSVLGRTLGSEMSPPPRALRPLARALIDLALAIVAEERDEKTAA